MSIHADGWNVGAVGSPEIFAALACEDGRMSPVLPPEVAAAALADAEAAVAE